MSLNHSTIRPGILVSLKTRVRGGVDYQKEIIENEHVTEEGVQKAKWNTTRTITDPEEHERASKVRSKISSTVRAVCIESEFGLICLQSNASKLEEAVKEARKLASEFNESATLTSVSVNVLTGSISPTDAEAIKSINSEITALLDAMADGIKRCDVDAIRAAASKANSVSNTLTPEMQDRVKIAVEASRKTAREIVKAGENAVVEIDEATIRRIRTQRSAFLDLEEGGDVTAPSAATRAVDLSAAG